jgi:hypothetical protein
MMLGVPTTSVVVAVDSCAKALNGTNNVRKKSKYNILLQKQKR